MILTGLLLLGLTGGSGAAQAASDPLDLAPLAARNGLCSVTSVGFFGALTTVIAGGSAPALHYRVGQGPWLDADVALNSPHSILRMPNGHWLINDTNNHRIVEMDDISGLGRNVVREQLAGIRLNRPHDQILDPSTGYIYLIDGGRHLFRFKSLDGPIDTWTFESPREMDYARALSWFDGKLHVIHSSRGEVWRIDDYDRRSYTVFRSPRPANSAARSATPYRDFPAGALDMTGLVLNDVEKAGDWYYGTNFFTKTYAHGSDPSTARLIRWRTWHDFEKGHWQDMSASLPDGVVPYFLTVQRGGVYIPYFRFEPEKGCAAGGVMLLE
ncbi:MAG: hypothetical protein DI623_14475 [Sphingomonas sanxanigenens]|uniref:6-bladed beta-propeller n=1 Tax=Sphingomonas sanxanigenens TaxID=397260 RepID=A0A2W5A2K6_9SPHN|nr:MAG: hypothetical protein DI623_14475 [Sphingomonas sanxanigenens]